MLDKLNLEIICKLLADLTPIDSLEAFVVLTNSYVFLDLINYIFTVNKKSLSLEDKHVKAIKDD